MKSGVQHKSVYRIVSIIVLFILAFLFVFPLYWIVTGAFKTTQQINSVTPVWFPTEWTLDNFVRLFARRTAPIFPMGPVGPAAIRWLFNTVFMAVAAMILTCITASMAGYEIGRAHV